MYGRYFQPTPSRGRSEGIKSACWCGAARNGEAPRHRARGTSRQLDHWTFLLAFALVLANTVLVERAISAAATLMLAVALAYDAYEFYAS
ncbi:MAG: hypothetical protein V5A21_07395 [Halapricum sp.]